jgi:5-formyltetrahydrofolate cyclo-ligase
MIYPVQQQNPVDFSFHKTIQRLKNIIFLGTAALGTIVNLTAVGNLHVDIVVVASVVVNPITGARLGKGKGYGDIEYAMMRQLGACDDTTLVITTVHESQLLDDLPSSVMTEHDLYVEFFIYLY